MEFTKEELLLIYNIISNEMQESIDNLGYTYRTRSIEDFVQDFEQLKTEVDIYVKLHNEIFEEA